MLGVITNGIVDRSDLPASPIGIFVANLIFNIALGVVIYVAFGGLRLLRSGARCTDHTETDPADGSHEGAGGTAVAVKSRAAVVTRAERSERVATVVGLAVLAIGALVFDLDIGLTAMTVAGVLAVMSPQTAKAAVADISWGVVLLICGIVTYVGFLESVGTVDYIGHAIASVSSPVLAALVLLFVGSVVSAFASTTGILGALIPLAVPLLAAGEFGCGCRRRGAVDLGVRRRFEPVLHQRRAGCRERPHGREASVYRGLMVWGFGLVAADARDHVGDLRPSGLVTAMNHVDMTPPLSGVTVVDMTTALGEYAGRLLADLGADVIRFDDAAPTSSYRRAFMNAGKQIRGGDRAARSSPSRCCRPRFCSRARGLPPCGPTTCTRDDVARRHPCWCTSQSARSASPVPTLTARPAISP